MTTNRLELTKQSRRGLFQTGWRSFTAAALAVAGNSTLRAQSSTAGRAVISLQLSGGNDSNNLIVPLDTVQYSRYQRARGPLAISQSSLLPVAAPRQGSNASFGFHPALPALHEMYVRKTLAVVANAGFALPSDSHLPRHLAFARNGYTTPAWAATLLGLTDWMAVDAHTFRTPNGVTMINAGVAANPANQALLQRAVSSTVLRTAFPETVLGNQLKQAVQFVHAAPSVGAVNPVICCTRSGFDTHSSELTAQAALFAELNDALAAFERALDEIGAASRVTLYTQSEFNRTLTPNSDGGTEHAWGGHQLVMGRSVLGGDIYGAFPNLSLGGPDDTTGHGSWRPATSFDAYHATLAAWLGVGLRKMNGAFPTLANPMAANLGFVV